MGPCPEGSNPFKVKDEIRLGDVRIQCELVSSGMRNGGAPQLTGGTYDPEAIGYVIAIKNENDYLFLGSNVRVTFLPADGKGYVGLAKVTEGEFGRWRDGPTTLPGDSHTAAPHRRDICC